MKKIMFLLIMALLISLNVGCAKTNPTVQEKSWEISIEVSKDKSVTFTEAELEKIGTVQVQAATKKQETTDQPSLWTGVTLKKVLSYAGVEKYGTITVEGEDGLNKEFVPELVESEGTVLAVLKDGNPLDEESGPVQLAVDGKGEKWWIKKVVKIIVNP